MFWQKLTYSGTECKNYLYFALYGDIFDVNLVTNELKIIPTSVMIKKQPTPKHSSWKYQIDAGKELVLISQIENLVNLFEPKINEINHLKKSLNLESKLQFVLKIDVNPDASTPCFPLNKRTIDFLGKTGTEVDFDLYKIDTIGLLKNLDNDS